MCVCFCFIPTWYKTEVEELSAFRNRSGCGNSHNLACRLDTIWCHWIKEWEYWIVMTDNSFLKWAIFLQMKSLNQNELIDNSAISDNIWGGILRNEYLLSPFSYCSIWFAIMPANFPLALLTTPTRFLTFGKTRTNDQRVWMINGDHEPHLISHAAEMRTNPSWAFPKIYTDFYDTWLFSCHRNLHFQVGLDALSSTPRSDITITLSSLIRTWTCRYLLLPHDTILWINFSVPVRCVCVHAYLFVYVCM